MAAAGAQLAVVFTARGNPADSAVVPTLKVGTDPGIAGLLPEVIDLPADRTAAAADDVLAAILDAANGRPVAAERAGMRDFAIPRLFPTM